MRIGFLISVENGLLYDNTWKQWLEYAPSHEYAVFVHARRPTDIDDGTFAAEHLIDVNITAQVEQYDDVRDPQKFATVRDNYDVQRLLLNKALQLDADDNPVTHFVLCDADSIPVKSFQRVRAYLARVSASGQYSLLQFCPHAIKTEAGRKILHMALVKYIHALRTYPEFASDVAVTHWYWNSKFAIFSRHHAETICADNKLCAKLPQYKITSVSTHYPMLILSAKHGEEVVNLPTTFEAWGQDGKVRVYREMTETIKQALCFENLLFATGFSPQSDIANIAPDELWDAPVAVDPEAGTSAQYTGL